ncbi:hypothetical protein QAD02_004269 [Eretmocerus hayati]|uniref:Uncharacterized protein n=1 Tax=Eretmocerus hayati TaxID=131215 RepID=A0ACC2NQB6_9HYME|nr:hypothetical protein QAD02_004269 [Eretmocerus hayati]
MLLILLFLETFVSTSNFSEEKKNSFVSEYFAHRAPSSVIGITCSQYQSDIELIRGLSDLNVQTILWNGENGIDMFSLARTDYYKLGIFVDLRCHFPANPRSVLTEATNYNMFGELHYWLLLGSNLSESVSVVDDTSFGLSTDLVIAIHEDDDFVLYDVYNPCKIRGGKLKINRLGTWDECKNTNVSFRIDKKPRWNLQGMQLKMAVNIYGKPSKRSVYEYLEDYNFKQFDRSTRIAYSMWLQLTTMFNFTLDFQEITVPNDDDDASPAMSALERGNIDLSGTAHKMTVERVDQVKAVYPTIPFRTSFIFRSTSSDQLSVRDIFLPLSSTVWYLTVAISILSINALAFLFIISNSNVYENYLHSIIIHVGAFCQQGTEFSSSSLSGRIAILHILLFNLLLYNYYLASAVSNRLSEPVISVNDSLHELALKNFQCASESIPEFNNQIKIDDWETKSFYDHKWLKIPDQQKYMSCEEGMALVMRGGFAYHTYPEMSYPYVERYFDHRKICELQEVHVVRPTHLSIFVHINSSFTEMFRFGFLKLSEFGVKYRIVKFWTARKPACRSDILTADSITLNEVAPAIIFLLFGVLMASSILALEFLVLSYYKGALSSMTKKTDFEQLNVLTKNIFRQVYKEIMTIYKRKYNRTEAN